MARVLIVAFAVIVLFATAAFGSDPDTINDYCVADLKSSVMFNGYPCKSADMVVTSDFLFTGFRGMGADTNNSLGIGLTPAFASVNYPGLNAQGLGLVRFDYARGGLVPPHTHPRASEVLYVTHGIVFVGFVDSGGKFWSATLTAGDVFLFPRGLVHFQLNVGNGKAMSISTVNGQNPGVQLIASALFGSTPAIRDDVLAKGFGINKTDVQMIKKSFERAM